MTSDQAGRPIRVAVVTPYYPPSVGGLQNYAQQQTRALAASEGHEVVVITTGPGRRTVVEQRDDVLIIRLGTLLTLSNSPVNPAWLWQVRRWLRRLEIDVVSAHAPVPGLADATALSSGAVPVVLTYHSGSLVKGGSPVDPLLRVYERFVLPRVFDRCRRLVAVSPVASSHRAGASLIPPGVDVDRFTPSAQAPSGSRLLFVGRVERSSRWKGVHVLVEAMAQIVEQCPDAVLDVVGDGSSVPDLQKLAQDLGVAQRVHWHGALGGDDLVEAYRRASVVVLPSLTESESFGMTLIEAMACGRPVVGSDVGGIPFVVRDGVDGLLTPPGDVGSLARACVSLLADPERARRMGRAGREVAESRWAWSHQTGRMLAVLDDAVSASGQRTPPRS